LSKLAVFGNYREIENDRFRERIFRYLHVLGELTFFDFRCFSSIYSIVYIIAVIGTGNYLSRVLHLLISQLLKAAFRFKINSRNQKLDITKAEPNDPVYFLTF